MNIYESHLGGLFATEEDLDHDSLYCHTCGDYDQFLCFASNGEELRSYLKEFADCYDEEYIEEFIEETWG